MAETELDRVALVGETQLDRVALVGETQLDRVTVDMALDGVTPR